MKFLLNFLLFFNYSFLTSQSIAYSNKIEIYKEKDNYFTYLSTFHNYYSKFIFDENKIIHITEKNATVYYILSERIIENEVHFKITSSNGNSYVLNFEKGIINIYLIDLNDGSLILEKWYIYKFEE